MFGPNPAPERTKPATVIRIHPDYQGELCPHCHTHYPYPVHMHHTENECVNIQISSGG